MSPEMKNQLFQSVGQFLLVFFTGLAIFKGPSEIATLGWGDALYQPTIQGILAMLGTYGLSRIGPKSNG